MRAKDCVKLSCVPFTQSLEPRATHMYGSGSAGLASLGGVDEGDGGLDAAALAPFWP